MTDTRSRTRSARRRGMAHIIATAVFTALAIALASAPAALADEISTYVSDGAAIGGIDPVAYFTEKKPVKGSDAFTATHDGVTWKFATAAHRDMFKADPERYTPAYGGYCATGASYGYKIPIDPAAWDIHEGRLYLNANAGAHKSYLSDVEGTIGRADAQWKRIRNVPADKL